MENYPYHLNRRIKKNIKAALGYLPLARQLHAASAMPRLRAWNSRYKPQQASSRSDLHAKVAELVKEEPIIYLEFGVYKGGSIREWLRLNPHPDSRFVGFDTFTGLPEAWETGTGFVSAGEFSTNGNIPDIKDPRCSFEIGLFQSTLASFLKKLPMIDSSRRKIIHMDADIYSATLYVLTTMDNFLNTNDVLIFDEFSSVLNECRAIEDYTSAYMRTYEALFATNNLDQIAIRML